MDRYAGYLVHAGARPGDRILAQVTKSPQNLFLYLACLKSGMVYLPLNTAYLKDEIRYFVEDAEPALCVCDPAGQPVLSNAGDPDDHP